MSVLRFLCFLVLFWTFSLSSYLCCTLRGSRAPGTLWASRVSSFQWILSFHPLILAGWAFFFLPFVSWVLKPVPSWILGFKSFGLAILFFFFLVVGPTFLILLSMKLAHCAIFGPWHYDFLGLNRLVYHPTFHIWLKVYII